MVSYYCDSTNATATLSSAVWQNWQCTGNAAINWDTGSITWTNWQTATTTSNVWYDWADDEPQIGIRQVVAYDGDLFAVAEETEEEKELRELREHERQERLIRERKEAEARAAVEKEKREAAEKLATDLLIDLIGEDQRAVYEKTGRLLVQGKECDYMVNKNGGVYRLEKDKVVDLCIGIWQRYNYPDTDNVVALKLMLGEDEKEFNRVANSHGRITGASEQSIRQAEAAVG